MAPSTIPALTASNKTSAEDGYRAQVLAALRGAAGRGWLGPRAMADHASGVGFDRESGVAAGTARVLQVDLLALAVKAALERVTLPLATTAWALCKARAWTTFGHARAEDYARERLGRTGRWLRDQASLGRYLDGAPALATALTGADGGRPLGRVGALWVGKVAAPNSLAAWIDLARSVSIRELKETVRKALREGASMPPCIAQVLEGGGTDAVTDVGTDAGTDAGMAGGMDAADLRRADVGERIGEDSDEFCRIRMAVPVAVRQAFDETLCLFRAVNGGESSNVSFVEALVAEAHAGPAPPDIDSVGFHRRQGAQASVELALADNTALWSRLKDRGESGVESALAAGTLARLQKLSLHAGRGDNAALDGQLRALLAMEDELQRRLGGLVRELNDLKAWNLLRFADLGHYAEQRLGLGRTTVENRVRLARALRQFPCLRRAYQEGRLGVETALLVVQILRTAGSDRETEQSWVARAQESTVKRLRDELRVLRRRSPRAVQDEPSGPLDDAAWHDSLMLRPGATRVRVHALADRSVEPGHPIVSLRLTLPEDLAAGFLAAVESARRVTRMFSADGQAVPSWAGLLALLEDFVDTWDAPEASPSRHADKIYAREGWRCFAPGCTSRKNLEDHHIQYRSRGGDLKDPSNRVCLCAFHHRRGEHGGLARCRGQAPLGVLWRLGRREVGIWFRNERLLDSAQVSNAC